MAKLIAVDFHGTSIFVSTLDGVPHVAMRPICDALGLDWQAQLQRIKRHPVLESTVVVITTVAQDGKQREATCLPLAMLNGWLFGISANRVKPELRERLIQYQRECFDVLARHFGLASEARPYAVLPSQTLSAEQAQTLRSLLVDFAQSMPIDVQGQILRQGWAKLKAHFKVDYRHIPASQFTEAVSIISRHIAQWAPAESTKQGALAIPPAQPAALDLTGGGQTKQGDLPTEVNTPIFTTGNLINHLLLRALPHLGAEELRWIATHGQEEAAMHVNNAATAAEHIACVIASDETGDALGDRRTVSAFLFTLAHVMKTSLSLHDAAVAAGNRLRPA